MVEAVAGEALTAAAAEAEAAFVEATPLLEGASSVWRCGDLHNASRVGCELLVLVVAVGVLVMAALMAAGELGVPPSWDGGEVCTDVFTCDCGGGDWVDGVGSVRGRFERGPCSTSDILAAPLAPALSADCCALRGPLHPVDADEVFLAAESVLLLLTSTVSARFGFPGESLRVRAGEVEMGPEGDLEVIEEGVGDEPAGVDFGPVPIGALRDELAAAEAGGVVAGDGPVTAAGCARTASADGRLAVAPSSGLRFTSCSVGAGVVAFDEGEGPTEGGRVDGTARADMEVSREFM